MERGVLKKVISNYIAIAIEAAHVAVGHGGRNRLKNETSRKYANITLEMINIFLSMCETCQRKKSMKKKGLVSKLIFHSEMNSRCQVDLIDMQTQEDRGYKFIMVYQDHSTKCFAACTEKYESRGGSVSVN